MDTVSFLCAICVILSSTTASTLDTYNVDRSQISVSGISSGAIMATQFHVAYSKDIMGAGIVAGIPFHASGGSLTGALSSMSFPSYSVPNLISEAKSMASAGAVDPTSNMKNDSVYIFAGTRDTVVSPQNGQKIAQFYQAFTSNIKTKFDLPAEHCMPTQNYGAACSTLSQTDFMNKCQYSAAYELLNYIYGGNLIEPSTSNRASGKVMIFDQSEFLSSPGGTTNTLATNNNILSGLSGSGSNPLTSLLTGSSSATSSLMNGYTSLLNSYTNILNGMMNSTSQLMKPFFGKRSKRILVMDYFSKLPGMSNLPGLSSGSNNLGSLSSLTGLGGSSSGLDSSGYLYVPTVCLNNQTKCRLHVAFHGCKMGREMIQDSYVLHSGYNEVADANNIIIMYPQAVKTTMNPNGCWDWWGYTNSKFDTKNGIQMQAVKAMVDRLAGLSA